MMRQVIRAGRRVPGLAALILAAAAASSIRAADAPPVAAPPFPARPVPAQPVGTSPQAGAWSHLLAVQQAVAVAKPLSPMEDRVLDRAFRRKEAAGEATAEWFMSSAAVEIRPAGDTAVGGFYNVLSDTWLLARLDYVGGAWRLSDAVLAQSPGSPPRPWFTAGRTALKELTRSYGLAARGFADPHATFQPIPVTSAEARAAPWQKSLEDLQHRNDVASTVQTILAALAADKPGALHVDDAAGRRRLWSLPARIRKGFSVQGAVARRGGATLFIVSPAAPVVLVLASLDSRGGLSGISVIDLAKSGAKG